MKNKDKMKYLSTPPHDLTYSGCQKKCTKVFNFLNHMFVDQNKSVWSKIFKLSNTDVDLQNI